MMKSCKCCFALLTAKLQLKALLCIKFFLAYLALDLCSLFTPFRFHLYSPTLLVTLIGRDALTAKGCCAMLWRRLSAEVLCDVGAYFSPVERQWEPFCGCWGVATLQLLDVSAPSHPFPPGKVWLYVSLHCTMVPLSTRMLLWSKFSMYFGQLLQEHSIQN